MKKLLYLSMSVIMTTFLIIVPAFACAQTGVEFQLIDCATQVLTASDTSSNAEYRNSSVDANVVQQVFQKYRNSISAHSTTIYSQLSTEDLDIVLSQLYLSVAKAKDLYVNAPNESNQQTLNTLLSSLAEAESELESRGFIFLSAEDAAVLMGASSSTQNSRITVPANTANTQFVASEILSTTASDGTIIDYYYITAYNLTMSSNMVRQETFEVGTSKVSNIRSYLVEVYLYKAISAIVSATPVGFLQFAPYELLTYAGPSLDAQYTINATCVTTPKFIWTYSDAQRIYFLDGVVHKTETNDIHILKQAYLGNIESYVDEVNNSYYADHYYDAAYVVKHQYESQNIYTYIENLSHRDFYYRINAQSDSEFITRKPVPYAENYSYLN